MLLTLILIPLIGIFILSAIISYDITSNNIKILKLTALAITILDLIVSLIIFILFDCSSKQFQFVQEHYEISYFDFYLGIDGLSIYFVLLTTIIMPIALISNWKSIKENAVIFLTIILLLETSLLLVFLILDILLFYIFFESILAPLFILIGLYGSNEKVRASFYLFLYTLLGSLFMLLSIITMLSLTGTTDFDVLSKSNFEYLTQLFLFYGIFIAFAVKTPVIYLNNWLLKAHVESPLSGSIILAAIVLKLSLYGILRLILPLLPKAFIFNTYLIFLIGVLTIIYASLSTLRTIDVKELIAYSSVSHAAVYLLGMFSNVIQGIEGAIALGIAHGFVSSGLFICAGGILYDRSSTRLITYYRGIAQVMPIFSIMFFILSLGNCGVPLTLNFIGEFMSLYGVFERLPLAGVLASLSIIFSAAYTIFMFNRIAFAGSFFRYFWNSYIPDINKREFSMLLILILFTVLLGLYPAPLLDGLHYNVYNLIFNIDSNSNPNIEIIQNLYLFSDIILYYNLDNIINSNIYDLIFDLDIKSIPDYDLHDLIFNPNTKWLPDCEDYDIVINHINDLIFNHNYTELSPYIELPWELYKDLGIYELILNHVFYLITHNNNTDLVPYLDLPWEVIKYIFDISYNYQVYESTPEFTYNNWWYPIIEYHLDNSPDFNATTQEQFDTIAQDKSHFIKYFINKVKELIAEQQ